MAKIDVKIGDHWVSTFGLLVDERENGKGLKRPKPGPKTELVNIPGMNGMLDLSEALTGYPTYENIELEIHLVVDKTMEDWWESNKEYFLRLIVGKQQKITFSDDPDHYYFGRIKVVDYFDRTILPGMTLIVDAEPFRWENEETIQEITVVDAASRWCTAFTYSDFTIGTAVPYAQEGDGVIFTGVLSQDQNHRGAQIIVPIKGDGNRYALWVKMYGDAEISLPDGLAYDKNSRVFTARPGASTMGINLKFYSDVVFIERIALIQLMNIVPDSLGGTMTMYLVNGVSVRDAAVVPYIKETADMTLYISHGTYPNEKYRCIDMIHDPEEHQDHRLILAPPDTRLTPVNMGGGSMTVRYRKGVL